MASYAYAAMVDRSMLTIARWTNELAASWKWPFPSRERGHDLAFHYINPDTFSVQLVAPISSLLRPNHPVPEPA